MRGSGAAEPKGVLRTAPEALEPLGLIRMPDAIREVLETVAVAGQIPRTMNTEQ